jgi:DHA2 family multidrug resistance protein
MQRINNTALVTVSIMLATVMQALDTTIANVALPHMQGSLSASFDQISWVLTSYIVAAAIMTPAVGFAAARLGRRQLFLWSVAGFVLSSALCGLATSLDEMVLFRLLQGVCGAALVPLSQTVLLDTYPTHKHGQAMAIWGMGIMVGPILGPTLGGWLTDWYSWRWVFYINVPVGILSYLGIYLSVEDTPIRKFRFDIMGFALLSIAIACLQLMLDRGEDKKWFGSTEIQLYALTAATCFYLFLVHTLTTKESFINKEMFKDRNFVTGNIFIFVVGVVLLTTTVLLPPFLETWKDYPVVAAGIILAPRGLGTMLSMYLVGEFMKRQVDPRKMIACGVLITAFSLYVMSTFTLEVTQWTLIWTGFVQGLGLGQVFVPASTVTYSTLARELRTDGAAIFSLTRNVGSSIGISMVTALLSRNIWINTQELSARMQPERWLSQGMGTGVSDPSGLLAVMEHAISYSAAEIAYVNDFYLMFWITLIALPLVFILQKPQAQLPSSGEILVAE